MKIFEGWIDEKYKKTGTYKGKRSLKNKKNIRKFSNNERVDEKKREIQRTEKNLKGQIKKNI